MRLIAHVAEALDAAALAGVYHGSLHPRDIIVTPGDTHVTGLGVAQALGRVGLHGPVRRPYVAPEREGGDEWGAPADIYALAAIAYEVLTGRRALPGTDQPLPGLADLHAHDAAALREVIEAAFDTDPGRRPARARDFAAAFAAALVEGAAEAAAGERAADRRPRKPRTRPHKLPGLDEPLAAVDTPVKSKGRTPSVIAAPAPAPREAAAEPSVSPASDDGPAALGEIRYVPVTDPADAGGTSVDLAAASDSLPEVPVEPERAQAPDAVPPAAEVFEAPLATGFTPDLRLADELLSRADAGGENVDADLAAALDRMTAEYGTGLTPSAIALDILGTGPAEEPAVERRVSAGGDSDHIAGSQVGRDLPAFLGPLPRPSPPERRGPGQIEAPVAEAERVDRRPEAEELTLAFEDRAGAPVTRPAPRGPEPDLAAVDASLPPLESVAAEPVQAGAAAGAPSSSSMAASAGTEELPRPYVRGKGGERRRPPSRYSRLDLTASPADETSERDADIPRALDTGRSTPQPRSTPDFEALARSAPARPARTPVAVGVAVGLILGVAGGYWLGLRGAPAGEPAPAAVTRVPPPAAAPSGSTAGAPPSTAPATTAASVPGSSPAPAQPVVPSPALSAPAGAALGTDPASSGPLAGPPARPAARVTRGSVQVTASQQANVLVDGERRGLTPRELKDLPLGPHRIRVTRPGYEPQEQTVVLTAEEPAAVLSFTLRQTSSRPTGGSGQRAPAFRSVLTVRIESTPPGARIRIDGRDLAPTPLTVRQLRPGTHTLELRLPGYKTWTQRLTVAAGDDRRITATLERDTTR
jgi:hypothetical protein